jgi:hypothetical protein
VVKAKLAAWHWCGVFREMYGSSVFGGLQKDCDIDIIAAQTIEAKRLTIGEELI